MLQIAQLSTLAITGYQLSPSMTPDPGMLSWHKARDHCVSLGLDLAIIKSEAEQVAFNREVSKLSAQKGTVHSVMLWIGGHVAASGDPHTEADW